MRICFSSLSLSFPSIQTIVTGNLVVVNISERAVGVLDPLATDTHWTDTSVQRCCRIGLSLMQMKFGFNRYKASKH